MLILEAVFVFLPSHLYQPGFNLCITKSDFEAALALARCS